MLAHIRKYQKEAKTNNGQQNQLKADDRKYNIDNRIYKHRKIKQRNKKVKNTHLNKTNSSQKNMKHTLINNKREVD